MPESAAGIIAAGPSLVVLATGATSVPAPFGGAQDQAVVSAYKMLNGLTPVPAPGEAQTLVYGGGETGCEAAEYLAARGHRIVLVSRSPEKQLARAAEPMYRKRLVSRLKANPAVEIRAETTIEEVGDRTATIRSGEDQISLPVAHVVVAQGRATGSLLEAELNAAGIRVALVGDVEKIGRIGDAVHDARAEVLRALRDLGQA